MRIELLLSLIKHYANNAATCILPNYIRSEIRKPGYNQISTKKYDYLITDARLSETACGITAQGLLTALAEPANTLNKILSEKDETITQDDFDTLKDHFRSGIDKIVDSTDFLVYQFTIEGEVYKQDASGRCCHSINHIFLIIQYKDEHQQLRYCMLQSYAREQSLLEFLNASAYHNNAHLMSHNEMMNFLSNMQQFIHAKVVDDDIAAFYKKYFQITTEYKNYNLCREAIPTVALDSGRPQDYKIDARPLLLNVEWLKSNMRSVCINLHTHLSAAQQQDAPQIIEVPQNCDNQTLQSFRALIRESAQQNPLNPKSLLCIDPYSGQLLSKTISKSQLPIIEALSPAIPQTHTQYPASKADMINTFKMLIAEANSISDLQNIFDIACVCINQHQNPRWDSFWGINNTVSLREIMTAIRNKALTVLFRNAPSEENNFDDRMLYFIDNKKLSLFNKHKNNFMLTGAFGSTHSLKMINEEIDRLRAIHRAPHPEL